MNAFIYILLTPLYLLSAAVTVLVVFPLVCLNWALTGDHDHDKGLIGWTITFINNIIVDRFRTPIHRLWDSYKPAAWTFGGSVVAYRKALRWWVDRAMNNFEYRSMVNKNVTKAMNAWERKFWTIIARRVATAVAAAKALEVAGCKGA